MTTPAPILRSCIERHQVLILALGAVMVASFGLFVIWPKQRTLRVLELAVEREREMVGDKVFASQAGLLVAAHVPVLRRLGDRLEARLPAEPDLAGFLQAAAERLEDEPVQHELTRLDGEADGDVPAVLMALRLVGPFEAVYRSVSAVEHLDRLARVRRLRITGSAPGRVTAEAEILVHYLPDAEGLPVAAGEATP